MNTFTSARPPIVDVLEPGYAALFERARDVFAADERVRAMWLGGSLARGSADIASDLDLLIAIDDESYLEFASEWREWLGKITPTVLARDLPFVSPGSLYSVTPGRERLDVVAEAVSALGSTPHRDRLVVFDRDGLDAKIPLPAAVAGPSARRLRELVDEFFRDYGMFNTVVDRGDWLLGIEAIHTIRNLLYQVFVESNAPLPAMGMKQWSAKLTPEQRAVLEALPTGGTTQEDVIRDHEAVSVAFVRHARRICARYGIEWPTELEAATRAYLVRHGLPALEDADSALL